MERADHGERSDGESNDSSAPKQARK